MILGRSGSALAAVLLSTATACGESATEPSHFTYTINGQQLTGEQIGAAGEYVPARAGPITVEVRWKTDLSGTNHRILISSSDRKEQRRCLEGTSCVFATKSKLEPDQESSWSVQVYKGTELVSETGLCVVGKK